MSSRIVLLQENLIVAAVKDGAESPFKTAIVKVELIMTTSKKAIETDYINQPLSKSISHIFSDARDYMNGLPRWEKIFHIWWLLGPFILLIERSPADLWLTLLALAFVFNVIVKRQTDWLKVFWVRAAFAFWAVTIISALLSADPAYAVGEALVWFRFPLFAMAAVFWLGTDKRMIYAMMLTTLFGLLIMCSILTAEIFIEGQKGGRLSWPYGDLVPGNYVAKVGMPAFTVMVALAVSVKGRVAAVSGVVALVTMIISIMTGERINFLIRACGGMLAGLVWKPNWKRYLGLVIAEVLAVVIVFQALPNVGNRYVDTFIEHLPTGYQSPYYQTMMPGVIAFEQAPILGIGTGNFRNMCDEIISERPEKLYCHPHPHNFYIQMAGETGIIGLVFGTIFLWSIVWVCFVAGWRNRDNVVIATAWVVPFGLFWPITSSADFFGQWNNIFMWSAVALALASVNISSAKSTKTKD